MESYEIEHIEKHLGDLIEQTKATTKLKAGLVSSGLITTEEDQRLHFDNEEIIKIGPMPPFAFRWLVCYFQSATGVNLGQIAEAKELYDILKTRKHGYKIITELLGKERQTGAWMILVSIRYGQNIDIESIKAKEFLKLPVEMFGERTTLAGIFPAFSVEDCQEILKCAQAEEEFYKLLHNEFDFIHLSGRLPARSPLYIERSISNRVTLSPDIFYNDSLDIFVILKVDENEILPCTTKLSPRGAKSQIEDKKISSRHLIIQELDDWNELVKIATQPIHLIEFDNQEIVLLKSTGSTSTLEKHRIPLIEGFISEQELVRKLAFNKADRGICICDVPGMGKSWLIQSLARGVHESGSGQSVFVVPVPSLSSHLMKSSDIVKQSHLKFLLDFVSTSALTSKVLHKCITSFSHKICFFFDGFDEILPNELQITNCFLLSLLEESENVRLCITSRPNMKQDLEQTFHIIAYKILPFSRNDQIRALTKQWKTEYPDNDPNLIKEFAEVTLKNCEKLDDCFLGIPLKCYMLAEVESETANRHSRRQRKCTYFVPEVATIKSISDLYQCYIDNGIKKISTGVQNPENVYSVMVAYHTAEAFKLLFPRAPTELMRIFENVDLDNVQQRDVLKLGILISTENRADAESLVYFVHRTFAEYLVAKYFVNHLLQINNNHEQENDLIVDFFFSTLMQWGFNRYRSRPTCSNTFIHEGVLRFFDTILPLNASLLPTDFSLRNYISRQVLNRTVGVHDRRIIIKAVMEKIEFFTANQFLGRQYDENMENLVGFILLDIYYTLEELLAHGFNTIVTFIAKILNKLPEQQKLFLGGFCRNEMFKIVGTAGKVQMVNPVTHNFFRILEHLAKWGRDYAAEEVFRLFKIDDQDWLTRVCWERHPSVLLNRAVEENNMEMFAFFLDKTRYIADDILRSIARHTYDHRFVRNRHFSNSELGRRAEILSLFLSKNVMIVEQLKLAFYEHLPIDTNYQLLKLLSCRYNFRFSETPFLRKASYLEETLCNAADRQVWDVISIFFGTHMGCSNKNIIRSLDDMLPVEKCSLSECLGCRRQGVQTMLKSLKTNEVKVAFSLLKFMKESTCFQYLNDIDTLKLLIELGGDFTQTNAEKSGILHFSVRFAKIDWIKYLLQQGFDINVTNQNGETPLFFISGSQIIPLTKLLIMNGANIYAVNLKKQNIAHILASAIDHRSLTQNIFLEWCRYMLQSGYHDLWTMRDVEGNTPIHVRGVDAHTVNEIVKYLVDNKRPVTTVAE